MEQIFPQKANYTSLVDEYFSLKPHLSTESENWVYFLTNHQNKIVAVMRALFVEHKHTLFLEKSSYLQS